MEENIFGGKAFYQLFFPMGFFVCPLLAAAFPVFLSFRIATIWVRLRPASKRDAEVQMALLPIDLVTRPSDMLAKHAIIYFYCTQFQSMYNFHVLFGLSLHCLLVFASNHFFFLNFSCASMSFTDTLDRATSYGWGVVLICLFP